MVHPMELRVLGCNLLQRFDLDGVENKSRNLNIKITLTFILCKTSHHW
jgi:hypothetical protein